MGGGGGGGGRGADFWTDHRLVRSVLSLHITPMRRKTAKSCRPAFDAAKLKNLEFSRMFAKDLGDRLTAHGPLSAPPSQQWEQFKTLVTESAKLTMGPKKKVHQDWLDENDERIKEFLNDKKKAFIEWQNDYTSKRDRIKHLQSQAQAALRRMQDEWWEKKADEVVTYAATKNSKMFLSAIQEVYGPTKPRTTPLLSANGSTLFKEKSSNNTRWREHFSTLLNRLSTVDPTVLDQIPQKTVITSLDLSQTIEYVSKAIRQTSSEKSPWDGLGSSSTASSPTSQRKTCRKPSVHSVQTAAPPT